MTEVGQAHGGAAGKSQFMKYAARLSPRAVVTTGRGSSGAGLTVAAVKEVGRKRSCA